MTTLIAVLLKHVSFLVAGAFVLLTISPVQEMNFKQDRYRNQLFVIVFFGVFGILGTYSGNAIFSSIANLRAMAVITAGFFGGPLIGLGAGVIAGAHRFAIDPWGFSAFACSFATILEGFAAGLFIHRFPRFHLNWQVAGVFTVLGEVVHMLIVLFFSSSYTEALALVQVIALPMIIGNSLGVALFVHVLRSLYSHREKNISDNAIQIFDITAKTLGYLREGLNPETAKATAAIIHKELSVAAVSITNCDTVLAHVGQGSDHHLPGGPIITSSTKDVIASCKPSYSVHREDIGCDHPNCPFYSAIIVPLKKGNDIVGTLKFYGSKKRDLSLIHFEIAKGLTGLFSIQLELEDIHIKNRMLAHAEIRHLQAQINPHFLFNSLNTIASFCRTAPDKARELILDLSFYMRKNLDSSRGIIPLHEELEQISAYLAIEKARFGNRISVNIKVNQGCENWPIPSLIIQPLIENAIKHGIKDKEDDGEIGLYITEDSGHLHVQVEDNGVGITEQRLKQLFSVSSVRSHTNGLGGVGLQNSNQRLIQIYGLSHQMQIASQPQMGTKISFNIPFLKD